MYYPFNDPYTGLNFEVFKLNDRWYWWPCSPGSLPVGDSWCWWPCAPSSLPEFKPVGPFPTKEAAIKDARWGP